ncbi:Uncharacterised protein [Bordetella ansorpii]|uniref:Uncharacterized protein n=1 Tax=Bordetella ansorpii TaxID=288768 RepID=A0A157RMH4_9BORD|nr:hypothetical protein [Bordetella ansorpii]SAI59066.1 Uncharacterised protein [Bordetella ansorpii]
MRKGHHRRARRQSAMLKRIPITAPLRDELAMVLHTSLRSLDTQPTTDAFNNLAGLFNTVGLALKNDRRHTAEASTINLGAGALIAVMDRVAAGESPTADESAIIRAAINTIDGLLGKLNASDLYVAMRQLEYMTEQEAEALAC